MVRFEIVIYNPKERGYKTLIFSKIESVREYISAHRKAIEDYNQ